MSFYRKIIFCFLMLVGLRICAQRGNKANLADHQAKLDTANVPVDSTELFFPIKLLTMVSTNSRESDLLSRYNVYFSRMLFAFREPLMYNTRDDVEMYRFTWLRTRDNPISIRISKNCSSIVLRVKILSGISGYHAGKLSKDTTIYLTEKQWRHLKGLVEKSQYWNLPVTDDDIGADGAYWALEGSTIDSYKIVVRWSPEKTSFRKICLYMVSLSGLAIKEKDIY